MATQPAGRDSWRGVAGEDVDEIPPDVSARLRRRSARLVAALVAPYRWRLVGAAGLIGLRTAGSLSIPYLVGQAIDRGIAARNASAVLLYSGLIGVAAVAAALGSWGFLRVSGGVGQNVLYDLRMRVYTHVQRLSLSFYERYTSGRIIARLTNDIDTLTDLLATGLTSLATSTLSVIVISVILLVLDVRLGLVTLLAFPVIVVLTQWFRHNSSRAYRAVRQAIALVIVHYTESLAGIRAVQAYGREPRNQEIFEDLTARYRDANAWSVRLSSTYGPGISFLGRLTTLAVLAYGGVLVVQGSLTLGVLTAFILYVRQFFEPMQDLSQFYTLYQAAAAAMEKLSGVLEETSSVPEPERPAALRAAGALDFDHVTFAYRETPVLHDLSFSIPAGQTVALVGETGAGKSTVARLVARFYDPTSGAVRLDGVDLREVAGQDLRRAVVMVTQESFLFSGSVGDNIGFGRPEASRGSPGPDPGRGHLVARPAHGAAGPARAAHAAGGSDRDHHRPPPLDGRDRGPRAGGGGRPDRGGRGAGGAGPHGRPLRLAAPGLAGLPGLNSRGRRPSPSPGVPMKSRWWGCGFHGVGPDPLRFSGTFGEPSAHPFGPECDAGDLGMTDSHTRAKPLFKACRRTH